MLTYITKLVEGFYHSHCPFIIDSDLKLCIVKHFQLKLSLLFLRNCPEVLVWVEESNGNLGILVQTGIQVGIIAYESQICF
jgi:hypothetical protein